MTGRVPPKLLLLRAAEVHTFPGVDPTEARVKVVGEAEHYLETVAARLQRKGIQNIQTSVWYGAWRLKIVGAASDTTTSRREWTARARSGGDRGDF